LKSKVWIAAGILVIAAGGCVDRKAQKTSQKTGEFLNDQVRVVSVQPVSTADLTQKVEVTGDVTAAQDSTIGAKSTGKVTGVFVKDGDTVAAGQLVAQLDTESLNAQLQQALASVQTAIAAEASARAGLAQAVRNEIVTPQRSTTAIRQAQAQLRSAQANLAKVVAGARPQEKLQAQAAVTSAKSSLDTQTKELERVKTLVSEGALAGNKLDQQQNLVDTAKAQYDNAVQSLNLVNVGNRQEDIDAARAQVRAAQEAVQSAQEQKKLDPLMKDQVDAAKAQIESAHAQAQSAQAQVAIARQAIQDAQIRAPFSGKVLGRPIQAGTIAGNGTAIVRIIGGAGVYFNGQLPSDQVSLVGSGMPVEVTVDALPGKTFKGTVATVSPQADAVGRLFNVRIQLVDGQSEVKPGMFATGDVAVRTISNANVVPENAILHAGDNAYIFVVNKDKAARVDVKTGIQKGALMQVTGVAPGAQVIVAGHENLSPGATVRIEKPKATAAGSGTGAASGTGATSGTAAASSGV